MQSLLMDIQHAARANIEADIAWLESAKEALTSYDDVRAAANHMGVAYEVFRKKFRKLSGMPPGNFALQY